MSKKITNIISIVLMIIGAILGIYTWIATGQIDDKAEQIATIEPIFIWTYILLALAILVLIIVPIPYMISNPGSMKKFGIGLALLGVVMLIVYLLSSNDPLPFVEDAAAKNEYSRLADMNIISMYIMTGLAILAVIGSGVIGLFKKS